MAFVSTVIAASRAAWRALWRDARSGALGVLVLAVVLAVAAVSSVAFFASSINNSLQRDASAMLGGDVVLNSRSAIPPDLIEKAHALGLQSALSMDFPSMARVDAPLDDWDAATMLISLKAVEQIYPLRGELVSSTGDTKHADTGAPATGTVWADATVLQQLGLRLGDVMQLGDSRLRVVRTIVQEPDRGVGFSTLAPRVLVNMADLPATKLLQPASRVTYRHAFIGEKQQVSAYSDWVQQRLKAKDAPRGVHLETLESGRPQMAQTLKRAQNFLNLVALLTAMLSAIAIALAARDFASKRLDACAMLRVLGMSQRHIAWSYALEFAMLAVFASLLGVLLGYAVHGVFVHLLADLFPTQAAGADVWSVSLKGIGLGTTLLLAFGLPPVLQLAQVPALRVLRRELGNIRPFSVGVLVLGVLGFSALLLALSQEVKLGLMVIIGFMVALGLFALVAWLLLRVGKSLLQRGAVPQRWQLPLRQLTARTGFTVIQVCALSVGMTALLLLVLLRTDLIQNWQQATPADAFDRFVINILPDQRQPFIDHIEQAGVQRYDLAPMIRGRLVEINGEAIDTNAPRFKPHKGSLERELNLSFSNQQPDHNPLLAGAWQTDNAQSISVEEGYAKRIDLQLGDVLTFDVAGVPVSATITSFRKVDWASMRANFFIIFTVADLPELPTTYLSAYRSPKPSVQPSAASPATQPTTESAGNFDNRLIAQFPNITNLNVGQMVKRAQTIINSVIRAVEFLFVFSVLAGVVVLFAALRATRNQRMHEFAVMRALGAGSSLLAGMQRVELLLVGMLSGVLSSVAATALGWALAHHVFNFSWQPNVWILLGGAALGAALALVAGWWGLRSVLQTPVVQTLRQGYSK